MDIQAPKKTFSTQKTTSDLQDASLQFSIPATTPGPKPSAPTTEAPVVPLETLPTWPKSLMLSSRPGPKQFVPKTAADLRADYEEKIKDRKMLRERSFPFIHPLFHPEFQLTQGLIVVGALTGQAKSTTNANILAGFLDSCPDKKALVISNEETLDTVYNRVACIRLKVDFNSYHKGFISATMAEKVESEARTLFDRIKVVVEDGSWNMSYLEDVKAVLEHAAANPEEYSLVTLDYLQTVASSRENRDLTQYDISKRLGLYLKNYGRRLGAPVVVFAQLKSIGVNSQDFKNRIEGDSTMLNHAADAIEIVPDFQTSTTKFVIQKSRFGIPKGAESKCNFVSGRYVFGNEVQYEF